MDGWFFFARPPYWMTITDACDYWVLGAGAEEESSAECGLMLANGPIKNGPRWHVAAGAGERTPSGGCSNLDAQSGARSG